MPAQWGGASCGRQLAEALRLDDEGHRDVGLRSVRRFAEQAKADRLALAAMPKASTHAISLDVSGRDAVVAGGTTSTSAPAGLAR